MASIDVAGFIRVRKFAEELKHYAYGLYDDRRAAALEIMNEFFPETSLPVEDFIEWIESLSEEWSNNWRELSSELSTSEYVALRILLVMDS